MLLAVFCLGTASIPLPSQAQQSAPAPSKRKVIKNVTPDYPKIARGARLTGSVRMLASVTPDGNVRSVKVIGGSPIFVQVSIEAVEKWRWERASDSSEELVQLKFGNNP